VIQPPVSTSSLQHNVVLHSNINESPPSPPMNRFDLNLSLDKDDKNQSKRKTNSLMTVEEQDSTNDLMTDDSWHLRSLTNVNDVTHQPSTNEKQPVIKEKNL
jgi:hypothetical protein